MGNPVSTPVCVQMACKLHKLLHRNAIAPIILKVRAKRRPTSLQHALAPARAQVGAPRAHANAATALSMLLLLARHLAAAYTLSPERIAGFALGRKDARLAEERAPVAAALGYEAGCGVLAQLRLDAWRDRDALAELLQARATLPVLSMPFTSPVSGCFGASPSKVPYVWGATHR